MCSSSKISVSSFCYINVEWGWGGLVLCSTVNLAGPTVGLEMVPIQRSQHSVYEFVAVIVLWYPSHK